MSNSHLRKSKSPGRPQKASKVVGDRIISFVKKHHFTTKVKNTLEKAGVGKASQVLKLDSLDKLKIILYQNDGERGLEKERNRS